ncbi:hypothetical protein EBH_0030330 [Eimeria brunetti]|uniref:Uncharacterized protein n=1 Tax=Eimeria brunetti TaxID=51314 RepID=U6LI22_9EIME|nr:hypothetical protein EBH_0030330 [Eimeria brunetti]
MDQHPLVGNDLPSFGSGEQDVVPYPEHEKALDCGDRALRAQRRCNSKSTYSSSVRLLSATFISLAVAYLLLRCFELTGGRSRAGVLTRTLGAGSGRKCSGGGKDDEDKEEPEEELWIGDAEGTAWENPSQEDPFELSVWQKGDIPLWPPVPGAGSLAGFRRIHGFTYPGGHATHTEMAGFAQQMQQQSYLEGRRVPLQYPLPPGAFQPGPGGLGEVNDSSRRMEVEVRLFEGETLDMWRDRKIPLYAEMRLLGLFDRMRDAASTCRSLLMRVPQQEQLRLAFQVMRLLALELGAFSFVPCHLERLRSELGDAIVQLGANALKNSGTLPTVELYRDPVREVIALALELKQPRPVTEQGDPLRYRKKMNSLLQTATAAVGYCLGVVEALQDLNNGGALPSALIERSIYVLETVYNVHSPHIALDASLRYFIVACQNRTKIFVLLGRQHLNMRARLLPPLKDMVTGIHAAVARAGGVKPAKTSSVTKDGSPGRQSRTPPQPMAGGKNLHTAASSSHPPHPILSQLSHGLLAPHPRPPQPLPPSQSPRYGPNPLVSGGHLQSHSIHGASPQTTQRTSNLQESRLARPVLTTSNRESANRPPRAYWAAQQGPPSTPHPYPKQSRLIFVGASANAEVSGHPRHGGHGDSDRGAQPPLLPAAARPTAQPSGGTSSRDYGVAPSGVSHKQEAGEEGVQGLLAELLKGGVEEAYVFGKKRFPDQ